MIVLEFCLRNSMVAVLYFVPIWRSPMVTVRLLIAGPLSIEA